MNNFEAYIQGSMPVVAEFYAHWSEPCKLMEPVLQEVREIAGQRAITIRIDIDENKELAQQYGIYTVPTVAIFKEGNIIWQKNGLTPAHDILDHLLLEIE
jgi:thioredoxin 1